LKNTFDLGIGLKNLQMRLQDLFSDKATFHLEAISESKVVARITYPIH
jgi:two-component system, LytTR family, sensor kinase